MKKIYIDSDYKCHVTNDGTMTEVETDFFNNKTDAFIEGYRFIPEGKSWIREDGEVFEGEMIAPWKPLYKLNAAQNEYEHQLLKQYEDALSEIEVALGVNV